MLLSSICFIYIRYCNQRRNKFFLPKRKIDLNKNLWAPQTCAYATLRQSVANLTFHIVSFNFATPISKFDTFSSYHIVRTQIAKLILPFCTIRISMYQKNTLPYILLLTYLPQAYSPLERYGLTVCLPFFTHPLFPNSFFLSTERVGPYPQAQLYRAGRTVGWMDD